MDQSLVKHARYYQLLLAGGHQTRTLLLRTRLITGRGVEAVSGESTATASAPGARGLGRRQTGFRGELPGKIRRRS